MRRPGIEYFPLKEAFGKHHTPTDYYRAVRLFMTDALNAGITTVINYAHNTQSPAHVDAEIRAMMESGLRGRYAYSGPDPYPNDKTIDFDDVLRAKRTFFSRPDSLIDLGYGLRPSTPLSAPLHGLSAGVPLRGRQWPADHPACRLATRCDEPRQAPRRRVQQEHDLRPLTDVRPERPRSDGRDWNVQLVLALQ